MRHLNRNGHKAYLVGGGVRDILLGRQPKDFDLSTDADPRRIKKLFRNCFLVGRRFRLAHIRFGRNKVIETSTFRCQPAAPAGATGEVGALLQHDDNQFGTPEEDALRRDFTVNGLFYDLSDFSLIDHVGGLSDLKKGLIRSIGNPNLRFREDPVRMLRAVRFASRLGFRIESATRKAVCRHHADIMLGAPSRLLEEIFRLYAFRSAEPAFYLLWELKLMSVMLPEVDTYVRKSGGKDSPLWRYLAALDSGEHWQEDPSPPLMLAALLYEPVMWQLSLKQGKVNTDRTEVLVETLTAPVAQRFKIPKWIRFRLNRILDNQVRMDKLWPEPCKTGRAKSARQRLLRHESFAESLALFEMRAASGTADPEGLCYWKQALTDIPAPPVSPASLTSPVGEGGESPDRPPRRRRRRRRKPRHETSDS